MALGPWRAAQESGGEGLHPVTAGLLSHALSGQAPSLAVADIDWESLDAGRLAAARALPLLRDVPRLAGPTAGTAGHTGTDPAAVGQLRDRLATAQDGSRLDLLVDLVRTHAASVLGHESAATVPEEASLVDLGFSSFTALELRGLLSHDTGLDVSAMAVFDHPTPRGLARHLHEALSGAARSAPEDPTGPYDPSAPPRTAAPATNG
jgi:acyl carrier protein